MLSWLHDYIGPKQTYAKFPISTSVEKLLLEANHFELTQ